MNKPTVYIIGEDANIFGVIALACQALRANGQIVQSSEMQDRVYKSGSYAKALSIISEYVDFE